MKKLLSILFFIFNASLVSNCYAQQWLWGREPSPFNKNSTGGNFGDHTVVADKNGNVYSVGSFNGELIFGSYYIKSASYYGSDMYIVKYDANGNLVWVQQAVSASDTSTSAAYSVALDASGNVYVAGSFVDTVSFGQDTLRSLYLAAQLFLVKYDANGHVLWAKQSTGPSRRSGAWGLSLTVDASGNPYIMGVFEDTISFGTYTIRSTTTSNEQMFVVKYDANGNVLWANQDTPIGYGLAIPGAIAMDKANNVYISGTVQFGISFGKFTFHDTNAVFMVKYNANGKLLWAKQIMHASRARSYLNMVSMSADGPGNIYLTGYFSDSAIMNNTALHSFNPDAFLAKFDSTGNVLWAEQTSFSSNSSFWGGYSVACDTLNSGGGYLVFGNSEFVPPPDTMVFATDTFVYTKNTGVATLLIQFDAAGKIICVKQFPEAYTNSNSSVCVDKSGQYIYFASNLGLESVYGPDTLSNIEMPFIARWQLCGSTEGINNITNSPVHITLFPNPNNGVFTIQSSVVSRKSFVEIYNMLGEKVYSTSYQPLANNYQLSLSNQPNGIYLYRVISENGELLGDGKFVIVK